MGNRKLIYYIFGVTILASIAIQYFIFSPIIKSINETKNTVATKKEELFSIQKREKKLKGLATDYKEYKVKIDILNGMFPKGKDLSPYITQIQNAAASTGVDIKGLKVVSQAQTDKKSSDNYTQMTKKNDLYELPMEITINSKNYSGIVSMIETMERVSRYTNITKVSIKRDSASNLMEASINIKIYSL
ncbi:type 4a pilus biogenesis protein PilO [bacterium]|nr:type 4a pilus biogenesis protein PilO [bacterium]